MGQMPKEGVPEDDSPDNNSSVTHYQELLTRLPKEVHVKLTQTKPPYNTVQREYLPQVFPPVISMSSDFRWIKKSIGKNLGKWERSGSIKSSSSCITRFPLERSS